MSCICIRLCVVMSFYICIFFSHVTNGVETIKPLHSNSEDACSSKHWRGLPSVCQVSSWQSAGPTLCAWPAWLCRRSRCLKSWDAQSGPILRFAEDTRDKIKCQHAKNREEMKRSTLRDNQQRAHCLNPKKSINKTRGVDCNTNIFCLDFLWSCLTCAGFSHFFRKSSLALARNSFTVMAKQRTQQERNVTKWVTHPGRFFRTYWSIDMNVSTACVTRKRPNGKRCFGCNGRQVFRTFQNGHL